MCNDEMMPLISVIVPVYNVEKYLDYCIKSLINQSYKNLEILLIDDGSSDNSPLLCEKWKESDMRIKVFHKTNGGLSDARNYGLSKATGEYIGFVDSDDWIDIEMYERLIKAISQNKSDIACCSIIKTNSENEKYCFSKSNVNVYLVDDFAKKYFKVGENETVHYVVNKLYKKNIAVKMNFPVGLINEDVEGFFYALKASKRIVVTNETTYYYRQNPASISASWFYKRQMDLLTVWNNVLRNCEKSKNSEWIYYAKMNYYRANFGLLCRLALQKNNYKTFNREKKILLENLRKYYWDLMNFKMPFSRKILMTFMCINYELTRKMIQVLKKV